MTPSGGKAPPREFEEIEIRPDRYGTLRRLLAADDHKVVLCLGGGAVAGLCGNLALLRLLERLDLRRHIEELWGTSAGAVVGGGWATGNDALPILDIVRAQANGKGIGIGRLRLALRMLATLWPLRRPLPDGLVDGESFRRAIASGLLVDAFEDCPIPFRCIACSADGQARTKVFRRGPLLPAIFASLTVPGIVVPRPVDEGGEVYFDGGVVEKTPLLSPIAAHARSGDPRRLLLLGTHYANAPDSGRSRAGFVKRFFDGLQGIEDLLWTHQLAEARARSDVQVMIVNPRIERIGMFDFSRTDEAFGAASAEFARILEDGRVAATLGLS